MPTPTWEETSPITTDSDAPTWDDTESVLPEIKTQPWQEPGADLGPFGGYAPGAPGRAEHMQEAADILQAPGAIINDVLEPVQDTASRVASDFLNRTGIDPSAMPGRPIIFIPHVPGSGVPSAVANRLIDIGSGFTEPGQAAILPFVGLKPIQAGFAAQSLAGIPQSAEELAQSKTPQEAATALTSGAVQSLIARQLGKSLSKGTPDALKTRIEQADDLSQHPGTEEVGLRPEAGGGNRPVGEPAPQGQETVTPSVTQTPKFEETTPVTSEVVASTFTNPQTGETTTAPSHVEAAAEQGVQAPKERTERETPEFGYQVQDPVTGEKSVVSRAEGGEVAKAADQLKKEPENPQAVHSNEIEMAKPVPTEPDIPRGTIVGMGGAVPSEFELSAKTPTGIKNATVDAERAQRGLPPAIQPARKSFGEVWDRAMALVDRDPSYQDNLINQLEAKPRALTDEEDALILHRQIDLQNEYGKATRDLAQAFSDGRADAVESERIRVAGLSDQLLRLYNLGKKVGTETGRGLNARKMIAYEDFTLAKMDLGMRAAKGGAPLTPDETAEITRLHQRILDTQKAYDDYRSAAETKLALAETNRLIAEGQAKAAPKFDKRILAQAESIVKRMEAAAQPAADRLRDRLSRLSAGVDPTIVYDAAIVGSAKIARLGLDLAKFTDEMVRDFGEKLRPMIGDIWTEANKMVDAATVAAPQARKAIKSLATVAEFKESITQSVKEKVAAGQKDKITWYVQQLARKLVESGVTEREALIDEVHKVLQDAIPGITRREAMDAISGYGDYKQLSKDAITVQLRGMKGEMQQIAKLEDMAKGEPPLKSGVERRTPTESERQLIKLVNDAKYKFQVPVADPAVQLKSALDTLKTTLKNRIADYEDRIKRGDYAARPRRELELDAEASRLKAENERVKKQFQRGVQLERLKNLSGVERGANWITKWRRGFILSGPVTLAKLTAAAIQRMTITPVEEAVGGAIGKIIPQVSKEAPREGTFNSSAEAKTLTDGITKGMRDAWQTLRTGQSDLDVLYGKEALLPPSAIDFFGHVHGALKAPTKRAEFARSLEKRTQFNIEHGVDVSDPMVQSRLVIEAYKDANRSIFMQDNRVVSAYKRALSALEQKDKATGKPSLAGKTAATIARVLLPIVKVPTNIVAETLQYATGLVTGSAHLASAFAKGIENLKPEEADLIMRELKKGSLGGAVMLTGYFNPELVGGYYQPGEHRKKGEAKAGSVQIYGINIPSFLLHNPLLETMQIGATVRRVADSELKKGDRDTQGIGAGLYAGAIGVASEVPFVREMWETSKAFNPREKGAFWGELGKSMLVPQAVQWWAQHEDVNRRGEPVKRSPKTAMQHIETGIPGLREEVPKAKIQ